MSTIDAPIADSRAAHSAGASYERGVNYMQGRNGVSQDLGMAAASFLDAADVNDPRGLYAAGMMYLKGIGVTGNAEIAVGFLQRSAGAGLEVAKRVLDDISQGRETSAHPIVVPEKAQVVGSAGASVKISGANPVTPNRVLAILAATVVVVGGSGGGYWTYSKQQTAAEQVRAAELRRQEEQGRVAAAERERVVKEAKAAMERAATAISEAETEKRLVGERQAELFVQAEALRKREEELLSARETPATLLPAVSAVSVSAAPVAPNDWGTLLKQSLPHRRTMMEAALVGGLETVVREAASIRALPQPTRGDRKLARALNTEALAALKEGDAASAAITLDTAASADPADEEVATNLGFALMKANRPGDAAKALERALHVNPTRSSAWYNLGLSQAAQGREQAAYAAFLLTYQFAGNQQKSRDWFETLARDDTSPTLKRLAQRLLASPIVVKG